MDGGAQPAVEQKAPFRPLLLSSCVLARTDLVAHRIVLPPRLTASPSCSVALKVLEPVIVAMETQNYSYIPQSEGDDMHPKTLIPVTRTSSEHYGNNLSYSIHLAPQGTQPLACKTKGYRPARTFRGVGIALILATATFSPLMAEVPKQARTAIERTIGSPGASSLGGGRQRDRYVLDYCRAR